MTRKQNHKKGLSLWRVNGYSEADCGAGRLLDELLETNKIRKLLAREQNDDINHIVTQENFKKLQAELKKGEVLVLCYRSGFCGTTFGIVVVHSNQEYTQLAKEQLGHLLFEHWYAIPENELKKVIALSAPHNNWAEQEKLAAAL